MAHGEDTCLHSITAARYGKIKNLILLDLNSLDFWGNQMYLSSFSSMDWCLPLSHRVKVKRNLSFFTRMQKSLKGCFGNILNQKNHQPLTCLVMISSEFISYRVFFLFSQLDFFINIKKKLNNTKFVPSLISNMTKKEKGEKWQTRPCGHCNYTILCERHTNEHLVVTRDLTFA